MQTQTLEPTAKWQEVRADFVRQHGEDYASYLTRLAGYDVPFTDKPQFGLYGLPLEDGLEGVTVNFHPKNGHIACQSNGKAVENWQPLWPLAFKHILERADYENLQKTGQMPHAVHGPHLTRGQYEYLKTTGRMPYAAHEARLAGKQVDLRPEDPDLGWYWVKSPDKSRARPVCYDVDKNGDITCVLDRAEHRRALPQYTENRQGYANLWEFACKNPLSKDDYDRLVETGLLPGESPAAAADRGNVVSINAGNGATLVPAAPRSDGSAVTTTHNQPPEADTYDTLKDRYDNLKRDADRIISTGAAKTKDEADQATDLAERLLKIGKKADGKYKEEYEPLDQMVKTLRVKWNILRTEPDELKKQLKARVVTPWLKAEEERLKAERDALMAAGASPEEASLNQAARAATVRAGSGLGRQSSLRTTWNGKITDRDAFLAHVKNQEAISEALQKIANVYAKSKIEPVPPGLEYEEVSAAV